VPKLTQRLVDTAQAHVRDVYLWDSDVRGFGLRIKPSGSRSFIVALRVGGRGGQQRRRTIGKPSILSVDNARQKARLMVAEAKGGKDPVAALIAERQKLRLRELVPLFLSQYVEVRRKPSYAHACRRIFDKHILPRFAMRAIADVTRPEITRWHQELRETPFQANRCLSLLSKLMTWSIRHGYRDQSGGNPCQYIEKFSEPKRERYLSTDELRRLATMLDIAEEGPLPLTAQSMFPERRISRFAVAAIRLLLLTGARRDEIRTLSWEHVNLERRILSLPDSKTGQKTILLSDAAADLIGSLPRVAKNPFVFAGGKPGAPVNDLERPWQKVRKAAELEDVRLHDLRHTFASIAAGAGHSLPIIGKLLGHTQAATTARYAHIAANPAREAIDKIGEVMQLLLRAKADPVSSAA
jgi:integrase